MSGSRGASAARHGRPPAERGAGPTAALPGLPPADRPARRLVSSGSPYERRYGYSRAVAVGDSCWVAGTTDAGPDGTSLHPGDAAGQARAAFAIALGALAEAGFGASDVVRTRMYIVNAADARAVAEVNGELFEAVRPASTLVRVAGLIDPSMLVEVEVEARRA